MTYHRTLLSASVIALLLAVPLTGTSRAGGTPPASLPHVSSQFGPAPQTCPITTLIRLRPNGWYKAGRSPLVGFSAWTISNGHATLPFGTRSRYGYGQKIGWRITPGFGPIALHGWNVRTGQRIWFGHPTRSNPDPTRNLIAWPSALFRIHHGIRYGPELTFVPSAGCYKLVAQWKGGSWSLSFGAGSG